MKYIVVKSQLPASIFTTLADARRFVKEGGSGKILKISQVDGYDLDPTQVLCTGCLSRQAHGLYSLGQVCEFCPLCTKCASRPEYAHRQVWALLCLTKEREMTNTVRHDYMVVEFWWAPVKDSSDPKLGLCTRRLSETLHCLTCKEPAEYAAPNLPEGKFRCYSCRRFSGGIHV